VSYFNVNYHNNSKIIIVFVSIVFVVRIYYITY
jgi:hypothetical protein